MGIEIVSQAFVGSWLLKTDNIERAQNLILSQIMTEVQKGLTLCAIPNKVLLPKEHIDLQHCNAILKRPHGPPVSPQYSLNGWHCMVCIVVVIN